MASSGSIQHLPGSARPEEAALQSFPPEAGAHVDDVSYDRDDVAIVMVSFSGKGPGLPRRVRRHGDNDWRPDPLPWDLDPKRDLADQVLGKSFDALMVTSATGSRGPSPIGADVYTLELKLRPQPDAQLPSPLRTLKHIVVDYMRWSGVEVLIQIRGGRG